MRVETTGRGKIQYKNIIHVPYHIYCAYLSFTKTTEDIKIKILKHTRQTVFISKKEKKFLLQ